MKQCKCKDSHIWYGMKVLLDKNNVFYQACPTCKGRIETGEELHEEIIRRLEELYSMKEAVKEGNDNDKIAGKHKKR